MPERDARGLQAWIGMMVLVSGALAGCRTDAAPLAVPGSFTAAPLNPIEVRYARDTGAAIYRRRAFERTRGFVFAEPERGYGICLRAPMADGRFDHTLLILQRRIDGAISQVEDDAAILRAAADVGPCRNRTDWVPAR